MTLGFNYRKATQALNFFAEKEGGVIKKMKALKLLWLADRLHLRKYGRLISNDTYFAMPFGPVALGAKDIMGNSCLGEEEKTYSQQFVEERQDKSFASIQPVNSKVFSKSDSNSLLEVYDQFGHLTDMQLSDLSHLFPEWKRFETRLETDLGSRYKMKFVDFFENPTETVTGGEIFKESPELLDFSKQVFSGAPELY